MTQKEFRKRYVFNIKTDNIGGGSFGTVYKAYDTILDKEVAIKVSEVKNIGEKEFSLLEEYKAIENLTAHQNVANYEKVYRFESFPTFFDYGIMQYYSLGNLSHYLKNNEVSLEKREHITRGILEGIAFLHQHKVVHRDLKPSNVLVVDRQGTLIPKITDFGLSKQAEADGKASRFTNSFAGGTLQYSSPEQLKGLPLKLNTDLWSFGAIAYEILTQKTLFEADSQGTASAEWQNAITQKILHADVSKELESLPKNWQKAVTACLERDANKRIQNTTVLFSIINGENDAVKEKNKGKKTVVKAPKIEGEKESTSTNNKEDATRIKGKEEKEHQKLKEPIVEESIKRTKNKNLFVYVISGVLILATALFLWKPWKKEIKPIELQTYISYKEKASNAYRLDSLESALNFYQSAKEFMTSLVNDKADLLLKEDAIIDSISSLGILIQNQSALLAKKEKSAWENANKLNTEKQFKNFINSFPKGIYTKEAKSKLHLFVWNRTKNYNSIKGYQEYLKEFPSGIYFEQASIAIEDIENSKSIIVWLDKINNMSTSSLSNELSRLKNEKSGLALSKQGRMYLLGLGVEKNVLTAYNLFKVAVNKRSGFAMYNLGIIHWYSDYYNDKSIKHLNLYNSKITLDWIQKAVKKEDPLAINLMADWYLGGHTPGVTYNAKKGINLYKRAIGLGHKSSMVDLAEGYRSNHSYSSDEKAIYWLKKSVNENNPVAMVKMFKIYYGLYYSNDKYVNYDEGKKLLLKAVELEYWDAYKQLSDSYLKGRVGFPKDREKGVFWFKKYRAKLK